MNSMVEVPALFPPLKHWFSKNIWAEIALLGLHATVKKLHYGEHAEIGKKSNFTLSDSVSLPQTGPALHLERSPRWGFSLGGKEKRGEHVS